MAACPPDRSRRRPRAVIVAGTRRPGSPGPRGAWPSLLVVRQALLAVALLTTTLPSWAAPAEAPSPAAAVPSPAAPSLARVNEALAAWLELLDVDAPFLVLDGSAGVLRLHQGDALLRADTVLSATPGLAGVQRLRARLRRYRHADPFHQVESGPFDWEHALVTAADRTSALWFDGGLIVYADPAWEPLRAPCLRLTPRGLRALYDALADSTAIVVLPAGWDALAEGESP